MDGRGSAQGGKIFGVGLSRTGTWSLSLALTRLGFETRHFPNDQATQRELRAGQYKLSVLDQVDALMDIPVAPYYAQFDRAFPGSRFILSTRATGPWLKSVENHFRLYVDHRRDSFDDFVFAAVYGSVEFSAGRFAWVKEQHEANIRKYFADRPEDLLIIDVSHGNPWELLCKFLGRPIPDEPFPHGNRALLRPDTFANRLASRLTNAVRRIRP